MKSTIHYICFLLLALAPSSNAFSSEPAEVDSDSSSNLCTSDENLIFNCIAGKKTASLCIAKVDKSIVKYRFGTKENIEMVYPSKSKDSSKAFSLSSTPYPGGGENRIRFSSGQYNYYLYDVTKTATDDQGPLSIIYSGVSIIRGQKTISYFRCINEEDAIRSEGFESIDRENFNYKIKVDNY